MIVRQSTARTVLVGPILDAAGAAKTDEVVGSIKITKNGTVGATDGSATLTHDHAGKYALALTANDFDTVGLLEISLNSGTNDMAVIRFDVIEEAIYDALFASGATSPALEATAQSIKTKTDFLPSATAGAAGGVFIAGSNAATAILNSAGAALTLISSGSNGQGLLAMGHGSGAGIRGTGGSTGSGIFGSGAGGGHGIRGVGGATGSGIFGQGGVTSGSGIAGDGITGDGIKGTAGASGVDIRGNITGNITGTVSTVTTLTGHTPQTGDSFARIGANGSGLTNLGGVGNNWATSTALAIVDNIVDAIFVDTDTTIPATLAALPAALEAAILNEGDATALLAAIAAKVEEFLVNEGDATATIAAIATACNAAVEAGQVGLDTTQIIADIGNLNDIAATDIVSGGPINTGAGVVANVGNVGTTANLTNLPAIPVNWITTAGLTDGVFTAPKFAASSLNGKGDWNTVIPDAAGTAPTAGEIADAIWEEALTDHSGTSGSTAEALAAAGGAGDPWITPLPGAYTGSQAGKILADILDDTGTLTEPTISFGTNRPAEFIKDTVWSWVIESFDENGLVDLDSIPTITVYKNGSTTPYVAEIPVVVKRATSTGIYDVTFDPAVESYDDVFQFVESGEFNTVAFDGPSWWASVKANTVVPDPAGTAAGLHATTDAAIAALPTASETAAAVEAAILDEGDATALLAAIAAKVEEFLINEGDATATIAAIATACNTAVEAGQVGTNTAQIISDIGNLNDIAATDIVSGGPINTGAGVVANVGNVGTTANLTNLPSIPVNWITAAGIAASALNGKGDWATATALTAAQSDITAILGDTNELQVDWEDGGRLDVLLDMSATSGDTAADIYTYFTSGANEDAFKATGFATPSDVTTAHATTDAAIALLPTASQIAVAVEAAILDEGDATALLAAIAAKVEEFLINEGDATATIAAIATACNAAVEAGQVGTDTAQILLDTGTDGVAISTATMQSLIELYFTYNATADYATAAAGSLVKEIADNSGSGTAPTVGEIADAVWEEALADHTGTSGSTAEALAEANTVVPDPAGTAAGLHATTDAAIALLPTASETAAAVEAAILDEGDATALLAAIAAKVEEFLINEGDATATIAAIATACNAAVEAGQVGTDTAQILLDTGTDGVVISPATMQSLIELYFTYNATADYATAAAGSLVKEIADNSGSGTAPTVGEIADAVWEEALVDHSGTSGSTAEALSAAGGAGDPWITPLPGSYTGTQAGKILADILEDTETLTEPTISFGTNRPAEFIKDTVWSWVIESFDENGLVDLDSIPTITVYKNGSTTPYVAETPVVVKRAISTGIYDVTFAPVGESYDDVFQFVESGEFNTVAFDGPSWWASVKANTVVPDPAGTAAGLHATTDAAIAALPTASETAAAVEAAILDEGDATALLAAIAVKVEEFLINEGDAVATIAAIATACNAAVEAGQLGTNITDILVDTDTTLPGLIAALEAHGDTNWQGDDAVTIYDHFTNGSNEDAFKADTSGLATSAELAALQAHGDATWSVDAQVFTGAIKVTVSGDQINVIACEA